MKKRLLKAGKILGLILGVLFIGGFIYLNLGTYEPSEEANNLISSDRIDIYKDYYLVHPEGEVIASLVYYQGGLVETASYLPFALKLADEGILVYVMRMPLNLAVLDQDAFLKVENDLDASLPILLAGHSLGGASASLFLDSHDVEVDGFVLLASYVAGSVDLSDDELKVLSITASLDGVLDKEVYEERKSLLPSDTVYREIVGGNHAQFGHYGAQNGDLDARISRTEQQDKIVQLIVDFLILLEE